MEWMLCIFRISGKKYLLCICIYCGLGRSDFRKWSLRLRDIKRAPFWASMITLLNINLLSQSDAAGEVDYQQWRVYTILHVSMRDGQKQSCRMWLFMWWYCFLEINCRGLFPFIFLIHLGIPPSSFERGDCQRSGCRCNSLSIFRRCPE